MTNSLATRRPCMQFALSTHWTQLHLAAQVGSQSVDARAAFQAFCRRYWSAVYAVVRLRHPEDRAHDLTQQFFLSHLIERDGLSKVAPERGQFRAWLWTALQRFLIDDWRHRTRQKHDARVERPLDNEAAVLESAVGSARDYEYFYARNIAERSLGLLHERWAPRLARRGVTAEPCTLLTWLIERDPRAIATQLQIQPDNARQIIRRLYVDLWQIFQAEVADTVADAAQLELEMTEICGVLGIEPPPMVRA